MSNNLLIIKNNLLDCFKIRNKSIPESSLNILVDLVSLNNHKRDNKNIHSLLSKDTKINKLIPCKKY